MKLLLTLFFVFLLSVSTLSAAAKVSDATLSSVNEIDGNGASMNESSVTIKEIKKLLIESCKKHPDCPYTSIKDFDNRVGLTINYDPSKALTVKELINSTAEMLKNPENKD